MVKDAGRDVSGEGVPVPVDGVDPKPRRSCRDVPPEQPGHSRLDLGAHIRPGCLVDCDGSSDRFRLLPAARRRYYWRSPAGNSAESKPGRPVQTARDGRRIEFARQSQQIRLARAGREVDQQRRPLEMMPWFGPLARVAGGRFPVLGEEFTHRPVLQIKEVASEKRNHAAGALQKGCIGCHLVPC